MKRITTICFAWIISFSLAGQAKVDTTRLAILKAAQEIMISAGKCGLITYDNKGVSQARPMDPFPPEANFTVWLATNPSSRKVVEIGRNPRVVLYYVDEGDNGYVTIHGTATLVSDQKEKDTRWKPAWKDFYPNRTDQYLLIKVVPDYLEVINVKLGLTGNPKTWQPARVTFE